MNIIFDDPVTLLLSVGEVVIDHNRSEIEDVWLDGVAIWHTADKKLKNEILRKFEDEYLEARLYNPYRDER